MHPHQRLYGLLIAVSALVASPLVYAKHDGGDDGSSHGNGHGNGPPPSHGGGDGNTNPGGSNSGGTKVKAPAGTCTDESAGVDLQGPDGQSGSSHVAHTDFGLMDVTTGNSVPSDESARMMYFWYGSTFDYVLNAHQLPAGTEWTLTYQPEPLPSSGVMCLGTATVNGGGQLHLANSLELDSNLPTALDPTADPSTQPADALLALVPSADVDCSGGTMTNFEPNVYLWSAPRVRYIDTDLLPAVQ